MGRLRRSWLPWAVGPALLAVWAVLGVFFRNSPDIGWLPKWALIASVLAPAVWIALYTAEGLAGHGKWWRTDLGINMVWLEVSVIFTNGMIAWAQFFNHGQIDTPLQAWMYIGGVLAGTVVISWRSVIWFRNYRIEPPLLKRVRELEAEVAELRTQLAA